MPDRPDWHFLKKCFHFSLAYCPGSNNRKADGLSRQYGSTEENPSPDCILPTSACLAATYLDLKQEVLNYLTNTLAS